MKKDIIITVGCDYGARGPEVAKKIAEDLGMQYYDRALIDRIIEETGVSHELTQMAEAGVAVKGRSAGAPGGLSSVNYSDLTDKVVYIQTQIIKKLADRGPCVFVGRCADHVLRDRTNVLNVFIYAPDEYRLARIGETLGISEAAAKIQMEKNDAQLIARYERMTGSYMGDRHNRHLMIDSSVLGTEKTAVFIEEFAAKMFPGE